MEAGGQSAAAEARSAADRFAVGGLFDSIADEAIRTLSHSRHVFPRFVCVSGSHLTHVSPPMCHSPFFHTCSRRRQLFAFGASFCCRQLFGPRRFGTAAASGPPPAGDSARAFGFRSAGCVDHCVGVCHRGNRRAEPIQCARRSGESMRPPTRVLPAHAFSPRVTPQCVSTHVPHLPHAVPRILIRRWSPTAGCATSSSRSSQISRGPSRQHESPRRASSMRSRPKSSLTGTVSLLPDGFMCVCRSCMHPHACARHRSPPWRDTVSLHTRVLPTCHTLSTPLT